MAAYEPRHYRAACRADGLVTFEARVRETDLWIAAESDLTSLALKSISDHRRALERYMEERPEFLGSLAPLPADPLAPALATEMLKAGQAAGTGPMAAVAGAIAQAVAKDLLVESGRVLVENGGDLHLALGRDAVVGVWAGKSPFSGRLGLKIAAEAMPMAVCSSSGTVGHSLSAGRADCATVVAKNAALADAAATALGNRVQKPKHLASAVEWARSLPGVVGALAIMGKDIAAAGDLELVEPGGANGEGK